MPKQGKHIRLIRILPLSLAETHPAMPERRDTEAALDTAAAAEVRGIMDDKYAVFMDRFVADFRAKQEEMRAAIAKWRFSRSEKPRALLERQRRLYWRENTFRPVQKMVMSCESAIAADAEEQLAAINLEFAKVQAEILAMKNGAWRDLQPYPE